MRMVIFSANYAQNVRDRFKKVLLRFYELQLNKNSDKVISNDCFALMMRNNDISRNYNYQMYTKATHRSSSDGDDL